MPCHLSEQIDDPSPQGKGEMHLNGSQPRRRLPFRFQIPQQPLKRLLVAVVVSPVGELGDKVLADVAG